MADSAVPPPGVTLIAPSKLGIRTGEFVVMIAGLMALNALAIDVMLPALDDISRELGVTHPNDQQLVIYMYILGFGFPQLVWGPVSDSLGRRPVMFAALIGYTVTGFACMLAKDFALLLAMRFCQGIFAAGVRVVAVSVVRDVFSGRGMARIMSLVMTIFMVVPILAPSIGQAIIFVAPWAWTFGILGLAGLLMLAWTYIRLRETLPEADRWPLNLRATGDAYLQVIRTRVTFGYMCASGVIFGSLFGFIGSAEQIFTDVFGQEESFPLWFAGIALCLSAANFTNSRLVERVGMRRLSHGALVGFTLLALTLAVAMRVGGERLEIFFPLFALIFACFGLIGSNFSALAMEPQGQHAGTASAVYGFATTTVASVFGWMIGSQFDGTSVPLLTGYVLLGLTSLTIVLIAERGRLFDAR